MFNRFEWMIGLRYLRAKRSNHFIGVITVLSMGGIALGVAALIVVLAVMTGFKEELQKQILGVTSHVVVQELGGRMAHYTQVLDKVLATPGVKAASPFILGQAMLNSNGKSHGVVIRGIDPPLDRHVSALESNLASGRMEDLGHFGIILGKHLASGLGLQKGDPVTVMAPVGNVTAVGTLPRMKQFKVVGVFDSGMYEYDNTLAYIHLQDAQTFFRFGENATGIEVKTDHADLAFEVRKGLIAQLGFDYWVRDWMQMNRNFFRALQLEKATMFVILFLVVVVAAFNIISSLIMVVMEKGKDIAILKTMGASSRSIMAIFMINGGVIGVVGDLLGLGLGLLLAFNLESALKAIEGMFGIQILSGDVYFIDHLPAKVEVFDVTLITVISLAISLLATLYPAWRASRVDPVESLRYE
ncbi:MAG: lipoprotein-releasing ABC transporter permease subunit [Magnetococcales bacterium]|nr:lipoprotein-releasing ABC transporter permease subunit [Magnetococcales bacterium]NGZ28153.1 lipoprotein-releasing ABC transporter permease subunit [Magnetococcales bacterium]